MWPWVFLFPNIEWWSIGYRMAIDLLLLLNPSCVPTLLCFHMCIVSWDGHGASINNAWSGVIRTGCDRCRNNLLATIDGSNHIGFADCDCMLDVQQKRESESWGSTSWRTGRVWLLATCFYRKSSAWDWALIKLKTGCCSQAEQFELNRLWLGQLDQPKFSIAVFYWSVTKVKSLDLEFCVS